MKGSVFSSRSKIAGSFFSMVQSPNLDLELFNRKKKSITNKVLKNLFAESTLKHSR